MKICEQCKHFRDKRVYYKCIKLNLVAIDEFRYPKTCEAFKKKETKNV